MDVIALPFQGGLLFYGLGTQGLALGYYVSALQAEFAPAGRGKMGNLTIATLLTFEKPK